MLVQRDLRHLYAKLIADPVELDWFLANVVSETWHSEHDLAEMLAERKRDHPGYAALIDAYAARFGDLRQRRRALRPCAGGDAVHRRQRAQFGAAPA